MVSSGLVALLLAAIAQSAYGGHYPLGGCGCDLPVAPACGCAVETVCPGKVIEQAVVVNKPCAETFHYREPVYSKSCCTRPAGVARSVQPCSYSTPTVCDTQVTQVNVPTTDVEVRHQPLVKKTCTTSRYLLQIPIEDTTCHHTPLCKKTVRAQNNLLTTVSKKTSCAKTHCTQAKVVDTPISATVCQDYQGAVDKVGTKIVNRQEVVKTAVQLPSYKTVSAAPCGVDPIYNGAYVDGVGYGPFNGRYIDGVGYGPFNGRYVDGVACGPYADGVAYGPYNGAYVDGVAYGPYNGVYADGAAFVNGPAFVNRVGAGFVRDGCACA